MKKILFMIIEILLIVVFLTLVLFVYDTSTIIGLVKLGVTGLVVFPLVLILDKKREKSGIPDNGEQAPTEAQPPVDQTIAQPATEAQPPVDQAATQAPTEQTAEVPPPVAPAEPPQQPPQ